MFIALLITGAYKDLNVIPLSEISLEITVGAILCVPHIFQLDTLYTKDGVLVSVLPLSYLRGLVNFFYRCCIFFLYQIQNTGLYFVSAVAYRVLDVARPKLIDIGTFVICQFIEANFHKVRSVIKRLVGIFLAFQNHHTYEWSEFYVVSPPPVSVYELSNVLLGCICTGLIQSDHIEHYQKVELRVFKYEYIMCLI